MAYTRGRCSNFDYCSIADSRRDIEVRVGDDFICPECGKPLKAPPVGASGGSGALVPVLIGGGILVLVGGAVFLGMRMGSSGPANRPLQTAAAPRPAPPPQTAATTAPPVSTPAAPPPPAQPALNVLVRLAGSPSIATTVAPKLAAAYLAQIGDTSVKTQPGASAGETQVIGLRGDRPEGIVIDSTSQTAGFKALAAHQAGIVMADSRITPEEHDDLARIGDMTSGGAEHILGLDALAVVVNAANALPSLSRDQIKQIFTGTLKDWSGVGLTPGPMDVYAGAADSSTARAFDTLALGGATIAPSVKTLAGGAEVAQAVAGDPRGIGVVELANIGPTRPVPIADIGSSPVVATNHAAVAADDYPLAYRLYLYTVPTGDQGIAQRFVEYALSPGGQAIVEQQGLVSQTLKPAAAAVPDTTSGKFKAFVAGAKHLAINFHFNPNSTDLDQKGTRDLDRVMNYILSNHYTPDHLILIGFADNQGDPAQNIAVSKKRADAVAALFTARGLKPGKVAGFGSELPIADNNTEEGREKNRRVEVFIAP